MTVKNHPQTMPFGKIVKNLIPFARPYRNYIAWSFFLTLCGSILAQTDPLIMQNLIDGVAVAIQDQDLLAGRELVFFSVIVLVLKNVALLVANIWQGVLGETIKVKVSSWASAAAPIVFSYDSSHIAAWALGAGIFAGSSSLVTAASAGIILVQETKNYQEKDRITFGSYVTFGLITSLILLLYYNLVLAI